MSATPTGSQTGQTLVFGKSGQLARELAKQGGAGVVAVGRQLCDLTRPGRAAALVIELRPALVINAAAWTAVDAAEADPGAAHRLNAEAPGEIARACADAGVPLVHVSTDYVFDGSKGAPYAEDDTPAPLNVYGESKLAGEAAVAASGARAAVLRTSWVFGHRGANFVTTMFRLAKTGEEVAVVDDQRGRPTWVCDLADAALFVGERLQAGDPAARGVIHVANEGEASWADLAQAVFTGAGGRRPSRVRRIPSAERPTAARRPADSRLDCTRARERLGLIPRPWANALALCLEELERSGAR